jgi:hypothetical protein
MSSIRRRSLACIAFSPLFVVYERKVLGEWLQPEMKCSPEWITWNRRTWNQGKPLNLKRNAAASGDQAVLNDVKLRCTERSSCSTRIC